MRCIIVVSWGQGNNKITFNILLQFQHDCFNILPQFQHDYFNTLLQFNTSPVSNNNSNYHKFNLRVSNNNRNIYHKVQPKGQQQLEQLKLTTPDGHKTLWSLSTAMMLCTQRACNPMLSICSTLICTCLRHNIN